MGYDSDRYDIETGIPQGSPLSPILYILYNADLVEHCATDRDTATTGYIDDVAILAWGDTTEESCMKLKRALEEAKRWSTTHASKFAPDKFQLTHFTRSTKRMDKNTPIRTEWGDIEPKPTCKYLGVTLDSKLIWNAHIEEVRRKATKSVTALSALGSSTWGITMAEMRKIYRGVTLPQMTYACSVWSNTGIKGQPYTKKTLRTLEAIQARAARAISGAYRATSRAALDVETHLLPIEQQIWKHNAETLGRMISGRKIHDLIQFDETDRRYTNPLKIIAKTVGRTTDTGTQEPIPPFVAPPWWQGPRIAIAPNAEEARRQHDNIVGKDADIYIYTDGSGIDGHAGAAAVRPGPWHSKTAYMGTEATSTVYVAEVQGINMAMDMILDSGTYLR